MKTAFRDFAAWLANHRDEESDTGDVARAVDGHTAFASAHSRESGASAYLLAIGGGESEWGMYDRVWDRYVEHRRLKEISTAVHDEEWLRAETLLRAAARVSPSLRFDPRVREAVSAALKLGDIVRAARSFSAAVDAMEHWRWSRRLPRAPSLLRMFR